MIIASNFKTNHTRASTKDFLQTISEVETKNEVMVFVPFTAFDNYTCTIGAQNFYPVECGSFTGEIGSNQLAEFGVKTVLIGHSERREIIKEESQLIAKKFNFAKERGWRVVYCIGEPLSVREDDEVMSYLNKQLEIIDLEYSNLVLAYEPIWAIGTGVSATLEQIEQTCSQIKQASKAPLLYGGDRKSVV